jgi:hypothetical protein
LAQSSNYIIVSAFYLDSHFPALSDDLAIYCSVSHFDGFHVDLVAFLSEVLGYCPSKPPFVRHLLSLPKQLINRITFSIDLASFPFSEIPFFVLFRDEGEALFDQFCSFLSS